MLCLANQMLCLAIQMLCLANQMLCLANQMFFKYPNVMSIYQDFMFN